MRILYIKKHKLIHILIGVCLLGPVLYLLLSDILKKNPTFKGFSERLTRADPVFMTELGNFEPEPQPPAVGPGEGGKRHELQPDQENEAAQSLSEYGMNMVCSDEISLDRTIPDLRLDECKHWNYPTKMPKTSVIIVFHNEGWSTLMRTVHSVINRTPTEFLEEVLLVDDFSNKSDLKDKLDTYILQFNGKVRLIRNRQREGLIRTRSRGAREARGEIIIFLDAHCEVNINWLPPLVAPIFKDRKVMTVPVIDGIDYNTFEYRTVYQEGHHFRGIFEWGMLYKENELPAREAQTRKHNSEPYRAPTHAGGLFAINRLYFLELGAYDPGLLVWGGENFELSFKIWQCGGSILWVPCSRVGHVYRSFMPYNFGNLARPILRLRVQSVKKIWQCGGSILWVPCSRVGHVYRSFMPYNFGNLARPLLRLRVQSVKKIWQCGGSILWVPCSRVGHVYRSFMPYNFVNLAQPILGLRVQSVKKIWQCGGSILWVPCSRVGHVYRSFMPYNFGNLARPILGLRVQSVKKIWQCGGSILWVPCSRVGHVYRSFMPYNFGNLAKKKKGPLITINYKRVIETWFDEKHKEYFYTREPLARFLDMGDISEQLALKDKLQCKDFQWFMDNIAYDVYDKFPELPPNLHWGELHNVASQSCMDTMGHGPPTLMGMAHCHGFGNNQLVRLNAKGQMGIGERCVDADTQGLKLVFCKLGTVDGPWLYDEETHTLLHKHHKKCIALHPNTHHLSLSPCDTVNTYQQWIFKEIQPHWT